MAVPRPGDTIIAVMRVTGAGKSSLIANVTEHTGLDDADILQMTAEYLQTISQENLKLTSVLFLHKISDNRLTGSSKRLQRVYEQICGHEAFGSVVLGTTMWSDIGDESKAIAREKELREGDFWGRMIQGGSDYRRLKNEQSSAQDLAMVLLKKTPVEMQLQRELNDNGGALIHTSAGRELDRMYNDRAENAAQKA